MDYQQAARDMIQRRKQKVNSNDPRSSQGIFSRGSNVYNGGSSAAHRGGGPQFGRPRTGTQPQPRARTGPVVKTGNLPASGRNQNPIFNREIINRVLQARRRV